MMALSETASLDPSTADLINLRKILEACIYIPDISEVSQRSGLSREQRFCLALDRFESTTRVFDQSHYESEVLRIGTTEEELDDRLRREARDIGVPESHFPAVKRRRISRLSKHQSHLRQSLVGPAMERKTSASPIDQVRSSSGNNGSIVSTQATRTSTSSRPSVGAVARQSTASMHRPTPSASVASFKSTSSQSSSFSNRIFGKRRDSRHSLMQFFRRDSSRDSSISPDNDATSTTESSLAHNNNQNIIVEEPDLTSPHSHESQDLSSIPSLSMSSQTSLSSLGDQQPYQDLGGVDKQIIEQFIYSRSFVQLRKSCEEEMQRFNSFATDQHVALPLILGRNHLYNQERKQVRLSELQKEHEAEIEKIEDRHAEKELNLREMHRFAMSDEAIRNATAVKYVSSRIALLGDEATAEHHSRLEEEQAALKRLTKKHDVEMRNLVRYQDSKKLEMLRRHEKEYKELSKGLDTGLEIQRKDKAAKLQHNISRLDELVEDRRAKLIARFFLRLQILKAISSSTAVIEAALPLSLLGLPPVFTASLGYS